jgi:putative DNA primase/helicase
LNATSNRTADRMSQSPGRGPDRRGNGDPKHDVLSRLQGVKPQPAGGWVARCPAHEDRRASLSVSIADDGKVLLHCHAGCKPQDILNAIDLTMADLFPITSLSRGLRSIERTYDYHDEQGRLLYQAVRYKPKDFRQRRPDGKGGWVWRLDDVRRVLYRLPELTAASRGALVFVVEGEKDADNLANLGLVATTCAMGAGKWRQEYNPALASRHVVILADNDKPGREHAAQVAAALCGVAASIKIVELPGLPLKGDVSDWLAAGGTVDRLMELVDAAPSWVPPDSGAQPDADAAPPDAGSVARSPMALDDDEPHRTDLGNARRLVAQHGTDLRYIHPWKTWLVWDGRRWAEDTTGEVVRRVKQAQAELYRTTADAICKLGHVGDDEERKRQLAALNATLKHALKWEDSHRVAACLELARSEPGIPALPNELDRDPWALNVLNGTIDLKTGQLRPHQRADLMTKLAPVDYDPAAKCPLWDRSLDRWMGGNRELVTYVQRLVGYSLTGDVSEQVLWFFHGAGANGKSTFLSTILAMHGDYGMQAVPDLLMAKRHESHPTERADLFGKRLVATIETEEGKRMAEALMKQLTGGDKVRARRMRQDHFEFDPMHKIILAANHKPVIRGTDLAVWRRIKLVPFNETIPDEEKDKALPEKLKAELPGILAWAVQGCLDWRQYGMGEPDEVRQATAEYQGEQDTIASFLAECCTLRPEAKAKASALYEAYGQWSGDRYTTQPAFNERLRGKGFNTKREATGCFWLGIGLPATNAGYEPV